MRIDTPPPPPGHLLPLRDAIPAPVRAGASSPRPRMPAGWWSGALLLPLFLGWVFGALGSLRNGQAADARANAETLASQIRSRLGADAFARGPILVTLVGHACACARPDDARRWTDALRSTALPTISLDAQDAVFSTLIFDTHGALRFAGSPAASGCTGDPVRLLASVLAPSAAPVAPFVSACVC
ncbi:hypothetical protein H0E82_03525 [Luteimonas sp. SJ-16]|uniref:Uncharacterized protein n=1 Tax=Luteimonas deserti TaxID=2752306 RepID=A0A7Z0TXZ3_9GAMM|nr:hypothetical protein [Luteimonas deserti]